MKERIEELVRMLNKAADSYYNGTEIISDYEYDQLYDELVDLERVSGIILPDSPTQRAGYRVMEELPKVTHAYPALSLDKTKDVTLFPKVFDVRDRKAVVMWKLDGSTVIADYSDGRLIRAATRGNGIVGSDISHNAPFIKGLPSTIPFTGALTVRGEAVMSYEEFESINAELLPEERYKNPRNLANASISLLDSREMSRREIWFQAFKLVSAEENNASVKSAFCSENLNWLKELGFSVVEHTLASTDPSSELSGLTETMDAYSARVSVNPFPVDGLVVAAEDELYAEAQPGTAHNPNRLVGFALKWQDETVRTILRDIVWQASRTGLLNPVAIFDTVDLEGTSVSRATLHNISYLVEKDLKIGDEIGVYKANKIIPKVGINYSQVSVRNEIDDTVYDYYHIPRTCPVCGGKVEVADEKNSGSYSAYCRNPECPAKKVGAFVHFVSRNSMNILGLSEATIEKFIDWGYLKEFADFWKLERFHDQILEMEGFGEKAFARIMKETEKARKVSFRQFITAIGIPDVGPGQAKLLYEHYCAVLEPGKDIVETFLAQCRDQDASFAEITGFGEVMNDKLHLWGKSRLNASGDIQRLLEQIEITDRLVPAAQDSNDQFLAGKTFVITGSLTYYQNREELKKIIEELGGKTSESVSAKTSYLINNDIQSTSSKNQKAAKLQIPIITEEQFRAMIGQAEAE